MKLFALLLFLIGIICLVCGGYLYFQRINPQRLSFKTSEASNLSQKSTSLTLKPIRILLPGEQIDTPLIEAQIHGTNWELTDKGASYLTSSPLPGAKGNSIIYGHDFANIFGKLTMAKPGDKISINFNDGSTRKFKIITTQIVDPSQGEVLKNTEEALLTVYTCTGLFDLKRFVVVAKPDIT